MKISGNYAQPSYRMGISPNFKASAHLSFRDCINLIAEPALLDKGINKSVSYDAARICKQLTDLENITPMVVKECKKQLVGVNEVFGRISDSISRFLRDDAKSASRLSEGLFVKQKAKLVKAYGKETYKVNVPHVEISKEAIAKESKRIAAERAETTARDYTRRHEMTPQAKRIYNEIGKEGIHTLEDFIAMFSRPV